MAQGVFSKSTILACGFALAITGAACGGNDGDALENNAETGGIDMTADNNLGDNDAASPMTITGCLQQDEGLMTTYILTEASRGAVGTAGTAGTGGVAGQQLAAARDSYRLSGDDDNLEALVGKRVEVTGMLAERSDLGAGAMAGDRSGMAAGDTRTDGNMDDMANRDDSTAAGAERDIDTGDLAEIEVSSVREIDGACGTSGNAGDQANPSR